MKWLDEEIELLKENYQEYNDKELSEIIFKGKRSERSIEKKRLTLGLKKSNKREIWSEKEKDKLKRLFPYYTNRELSEQFFKNRSRRAIEEMGNILGFSKTEEAIRRGNVDRSKAMISTNIGKPKSEKQKKQHSEKMKKLYQDGVIISPWKGRVVSEEEREKSRKRVMGRWLGKNNPKWSGGVTPITHLLRANISLWKNKSMSYCDYRCIFTGLGFDDIHHINPFNKMIKETLKELSIEDATCIDFSNESIRDLIINKIHSKHTYIGLCITDEIHKRFHDTYSYNEFNMEDLIEFTKDYFDGKHDEYLSDVNKSINSISNYTYALNKISNSKFNIYEL